MTLAATLVAALAVAQPALADDGSDPAPAVAAETAAPESAAAADAPAPAAAPASQAGGGSAGAPPVSLEAEDPVTLEPADAEPAAKPAEKPVSDPAKDPATPAETTPTETPAETKPAETKPAPDTKPADTETAPGSCTSSASDSDSTSASAPAPESDATEESATCEAADDETPEACTSATSSGTSTESTPAESSESAEGASAGCTTVTVPVPPAKPSVPVAPPAPQAPAQVPASGTTVMVLVLSPTASETSADSTREETPSGTADADSPEREPVAVLAAAKASPPTRQKPIRLEPGRAEEEWLGAVRAMSPSRTIPASLRRCVSPHGLVPLSRDCMTARARAGPLLAMRMRLWPNVPTNATEYNEVAREIARARDRRPAREAKRSTPPTLERATPVRRDQRGPWASGGSAGSSAAASATLRIFALAAVVAVPFPLPRAVRVARRSSLVPTGELGVSLPERPG